jgi:hypothetical protein
MVVGQTLFKLDGNATYSPQFPRGGLAATFAVSVTQIVNSPNFTVTVQHRNSDDTSWTDAGTFTTITSTAKGVEDITGLKEILRIKYTFGAGDSSTAGVHFLMQAPSWRPY